MFAGLVPSQSDEDDEDDEEQQRLAQQHMDEKYPTAEPPLSASTPMEEDDPTAGDDRMDITVGSSSSPSIPPLPPFTVPDLPPPPPSSTSATRPRVNARGGRAAVSAASVALADQRAMDSALSSLLAPASRPPKKRGRPVGSSASRLPLELEKRMGEANTAFILKDYTRAASLLQSIIQAAPLAHAPYHTLGLLHEDQGNTRAALSVLQVLTQLTPKEPENWRRMAKLARRLGELDLAEKAVGKAVALSGLDVELGWIRGWVELERRQYKKAATTWRFVLNNEQGEARDTEVREKLVLCLQRTQQDEQAMEVIEDYLRRRQARTRSPSHPSTGDAERDRLRRRREQERRQRREERSYDPVTSDFLSASESELEDEDGEDEDEERSAQAPSLSLITSLCELYVRHHLHDKVIGLVNSLSPLLPPSTAHNLPLSLSTLFAIALMHTGAPTQRTSLFLNRLLDVDFHAQPNLLPYLLLTADHYRLTAQPEQALNAYRMLVQHDEYAGNAQVWLHTAACLKAVGTTEEERAEALQLYERVLAQDEGNAEARIGIAELDKERAREEEKDADSQQPVPALARVVEEKEKEKRPRRKPPAERPPPERPPLHAAVVEGQRIAADVEVEVDTSDLLQSEAQLQALEAKAKAWSAQGDRASLLEHVLPTILHTLAVASGVATNARPPPGRVVTAAVMPPLEDAQGRASPPPVAIAAVPVAPPPSSPSSSASSSVPPSAASIAIVVGLKPSPVVSGLQYSRRHRSAASRVLLSVSGFQLVAYVVNALCSSSDPAHPAQAVTLVLKLKSHLASKHGFPDAFDRGCPRLLVTTLQRPCIPYLYRTDIEQAYAFCQALLQAQLATGEKDDEDVEEDVTAMPLIASVLRGMDDGGLNRRVRRWLIILVKREKEGMRRSAMLRVVLGHSWHMHQGYAIAIRLYHQGLMLLDQRRSQEGVRRMRADTAFAIALALLHLGLSASSRITREQRSHQPAQLLRALAYLTVYERSHDGNPAERAWNVGRWYHAAGMTAHARRWYERALSESRRKGDEGEAQGEVDYCRRAAESLALIYKHSGNEELAQRLYADYCS